MIGRNDGGGVFTRVTDALFATRDGSCFGIGDFDGDGLKDLAFADNYPQLDEGIRTEVFRNIGGMRFQKVQNFLPKFYAGSLDFGDADGDGDLDILVAGAGVKRNLGIYPLNGGQFQSPAPGLDGIAYGEAKWADFNLDGHLDFIVSGWATAGMECRVYRWVSGGYNLVQGPMNMPRLYRSRLEYADFNGDGYSDFAIIGQDSLQHPASYIGIYNNTLGQFEF
jgi:hypothetical protein